MYTDFHMHSEFSDDSRATMERQIESAIKKGIKEICFTDHVDYGIKSDWTDETILWRGGDGVGTSADDLDPLTNVNYPEYFGKLLRMRRLYGDKIQIRSGLEFGIQQHTIPKYQNLVKKYGDQLDFILLSIHQVEDKEFWNGEFAKGRSRDECHMRYYEELLSVVQNFDEYDVLAHIDLISRYDAEGPYPFEKLRPILTRILTHVIEKGKGIEINTSSWHYGLSDTTPSREILKLYHLLGGRIITMGSDAHKPEFIADHMEDACQVLREAGFRAFYTYEKHQPIAHEL